MKYFKDTNEISQENSSYMSR